MCAIDDLLHGVHRVRFWESNDIQRDVCLDGVTFGVWMKYYSDMLVRMRLPILGYLQHNYLRAKIDKCASTLQGLGTKGVLVDI